MKRNQSFGILRFERITRSRPGICYNSPRHKEDMSFNGFSCSVRLQREKKNGDKYRNIVSELRKIWNMSGIMVPVVIGELDTEMKSLASSINCRRKETWNQTMSRDNVNNTNIKTKN